jgi:hypothetical protein
LSHRHAIPPEAVLEAYAAHERLALEDHLTTLAIGLHARAAG